MSVWTLYAVVDVGAISEPAIKNYTAHAYAQLHTQRRAAAGRVSAQSMHVGLYVGNCVANKHENVDSKMSNPKMLKAQVSSLWVHL